MQSIPSYANSILEIQVEYLDKSNIFVLKLDDAIYIEGTLQIHHLEPVVPKLIVIT